ncbi:MAG: hypothetical protein IH600_04485 [Bacteroidetes bacterium]|nr:hypothetical protein [Bacteroidota bacterium]
MKSRKRPSFLLLFLDLALLVLCVLGVEQSRLKAGLGVDLETSRMADGTTTLVVDFIKMKGSPFLVGDTLESISVYPIRNAVDVEQIIDQYQTGVVQKVTVRRNGSLQSLDITLGSYYTISEVVVQASAIAVFFIIGLFVVAQRPRDPASLQFHYLAVIVACDMAFTMGRFTMEPFGVGHLLRALFPFSNAFSGSLLLHFALVFPRSRPIPRLGVVILHAVPVAVSIWGFVASFQATMPFDFSAAPAYYSAMTTAKAILGLGALASVGIFATKFIRESDSGYRRQIAWAMTGTLLSTIAYISWQLSTSGNAQMFLPESMREYLKVMHMNEIVLNAALLVTATFMAIGIIRYRMFNIEVLLKRGTIYMLVFAILLIVYVTILAFTIRLVDAQNNTVYFTISIAALALDLLLFMPTRGLVQKTIDRYFFRVDYDFREALRSISERVFVSVQSEDVADVIISGLNALMHPAGIMVMVAEGEDHLVVLKRLGFERWRYPAIKVHPDRLRKFPTQPVVYKNVVEPHTDVVYSEMAFASRYGVAIIFPIRTEDGTVVGLLVLGEKKSGLRFTLEDIDLIHAVTVQAGLQFERLLLQQRLLLQKHETDKLRELNRMKSYFVSGVSHDLKTPLTSIKMFAELLEDQVPQESEDARRSLEIIQGECGRLARLINNVLDFTRMERGMMQYNLVPNELNRIAKHAFETMDYQLRIGGFSCHLELHGEPLPILADTDAIIEAVTNLLSNAMKYSGDRKQIIMRTGVEGRQCHISVEDHGLGIKNEDIPHLFEPFFRSQSGSVQKLGGVGLGLSLVKHIADAHHGRVSVESSLGEGSTFRMIFDLLEET